MRFLDQIKRYFDFKRRGIRVWKPCNVFSTAKIGNNVSIGKFSEVGPNVEIGEGTRIGFGSFLPEGITIGKNCFIGPRFCGSNDMYPPSPRQYWEKIVIKDRVSIGANCSIRPGVTVESDSLIGMGSVIIHDVPSKEIWAGNPCKRIRKRHEKKGK